MVFYIIREYFLTPFWDWGWKRSEAARDLEKNPCSRHQQAQGPWEEGCCYTEIDSWIKQWAVETWLLTCWGSWHPIILVLVNLISIAKGQDIF